MEVRRLLILLFCLVLLAGTARAEPDVYFLDTQERDCAVIVCDGVTIAVDGCSREDSGKFIYNVPKIGGRYV